MICKLKGVAHKHGEYNGRQYDKVQLYLSKPISGDEVAGDEVVTPRSTYIPTNKLPSITADIQTYHELFPLVGAKFDVSFDQYGNLDTLRLINE